MIGLKILQSPYTDPYLNLALENYIFRSTSLWKSELSEKVLFIYQNTPCVVMGHFQNPWREINVDFCRKEGISLLRRYSGGGAVYQDLGNVNYCLMTSTEDLPPIRSKIFEYLIGATGEDKKDFRVGERFDLFWKGAKISGSAFKNIRGRSYHHGTMLCSKANLDHLRESLNSPWRDFIEGRFVPSKSSSVASIPKEPEAFIRDFSGLWGSEMDVSTIPSLPLPDNEVLKLKSRDWFFGVTPPFQIKKGNIIASFEQALCCHFSAKGYGMDEKTWTEIESESQGERVETVLEMIKEIIS